MTATIEVFVHHVCNADAATRNGIAQRWRQDTTIGDMLEVSEMIAKEAAAA